MLKKASVLFLEFKKFLNSQQANQSVETYIIHKIETANVFHFLSEKYIIFRRAFKN